MRRLGLTIGVLGLVGAAGITAGPEVFAQEGGRGPNLVVSAAAEPPTFEVSGGRFTMSFTVANEGTRSSRATIARTFLSRGRQRGSDDIRLTGDRRILGLRAGRQLSTRVTLGIPRSVPTGEYYLIVCADPNNTINEIVDDDNCRFSGQRIGINVRVGQAPPGAPGAAGGAGAQGPAGPAGPTGPAGPSNFEEIDRTTLEFGVAEGAQTPQQASQPDEGSTSSTELAKVGPVTVRALCRQTTNGDNGAPSDPFQAGFNFDEDGDEAFILFRLDEDKGTMSWRGPHGPRRNVDGGDLDDSEVTDPNRDAEADFGGTGKHIALAAARDPSDTANTDADPEPERGPRNDWETAFQSGSIFVATSGGTEFVLTAYAGIDTLGVGDKCVFGGGVTVIDEE